MGNHSDLFAEFPILKTNRLILRQMTIDDAEDFFQYYSDQEITQFLDWHGPESVEQTTELITSWNQTFARKQLFPWGIQLNTSNKLIGTVMLMPLRDTFEAVPLFPITLGFDLSKEYWNKGYMTEALQAVVAFGLDTIGAHRIQAEVVPENINSLHLLKKLGFQQEGILRNYLFHDVTKRFMDVALLSLIDPKVE